MAELASIWGPEDLERSGFANPTAAEARFLAVIMSGAAGKEYRFGYRERHGEIYPAVTYEWAQRYLGLMIQPNAPMAADLEIQWISIKREGSLEYKNVALRFDLPPPATPTVAWPSPLLVPKKKPAPKSGP